MRTILSPVLSKGRVRTGEYASTDDYGLTGMFHVVSPETGRTLRIMASEGHDWTESGLPGEPWEHVSVSLAEQPSKCPAWPEMAFVKDLFWGPEEVVIQIHPSASEYVNFHQGCLHLWKPVNSVLPLPPALAVGPKVEVSA